MAERRGLRYLWRTRPRAPAPLLAALADEAPAIVQVLHGRGLSDPLACRDFLQGIWRESDDPRLLADAPRAVERLARAARLGEPVGVFTDYDADGVSAAAVLSLGLEIATSGRIRPLVRLPNRFTDGYGLSVEAVEELASAGARVIVTADCGSTAHAAARRARELGADLIVTDHHPVSPESRVPSSEFQVPSPRPGTRNPEPGTPNPEPGTLDPGPWASAYALINPWRPDCAYPNDYLCGAGVAYKLVQGLAEALSDERWAMSGVTDSSVHLSTQHSALNTQHSSPSLASLLDLVAIATVADVMPLVGENRKLVLGGLQVINSSPRPGVQALIKASGVRPGQVDATALGFGIAPRLNAAGRLADPLLAYQLLVAPDEASACELVEAVDRLNRERQDLTAEIESLAREAVEDQVTGGCYSLVCGGQDWPIGVMGLVAGKLAQLYHRPTLVYSAGQETAVGSGRSIAGFDLLAALDQCRDLFDRYGGHTAAAGFSLPASRLPQLVERFEAAARLSLRPDQLEPVLWLDGYLRPETASYAFLAELERVAPFGAGFPEPVWGMRGLTVREVRPVGPPEAGHLRVRLRPERGPTLSAIYWSAKHSALSTLELRPGTKVDAAFSLRRNEYNGAVSLELELHDLAAA